VALLRTLTRRPELLALLLAGLTFALYSPTARFEFLNYDDDIYVTANPEVRDGLAWTGLTWALTTTHAANWHPLTWISHQLDVELFGLDAGAHHRTNALFFALAVALLLLALHALTGAPGKSALAAALVAWHPLRVESVAWVAERKDLLAMACSFAALLAWARFARSGTRGPYLAALGLYALGLAAKPMGVTLPCLLLVLDAWPLARLGSGRGTLAQRTLEKAPFFALAALSALVTLHAQRAGGALAGLPELTLDARLANAARALGTYLEKSVWPSELAVFHPHPALLAPEAPAWNARAGLALALVAALSVALVLLRRRLPFALVGWCWFLGTLVPVLGLVQVGAQAWAERYSFLPSVGLALALVWSTAELARTPRARAAALALATGALAALAARTSVVLGAFRSSRTLFEQALRVHPESGIAHNNLAQALEAEGELAAARRHYELALEHGPSRPEVRVNLARLLRRLGDDAAAERELTHALEASPELPGAQAELGLLLAWLERDAEAVPHLRRALAANPEDKNVRGALAWLLATSASVPDAAAALELVLPLCTPEALPASLETRAAALARLGRFPEAVEWQARALERGAGARTRARLELYRAGQAFVRAR
jgi:tetratricopeptide (TPR) repeat protein